jgi:plasmid maintenance system antidote protein VapI
MGTIKKKKLTIGEQIRQALMTQKKLAKITGIHEVRLSRGINDEIQFTTDELQLIEDALQIIIQQ